jgi:hypothetical protein
MSGNFGIHNRDFIGKAYFVRGTLVIDENRNIFANSITLQNSINMFGNVTAGNLIVSNFISSKKLAANDIMGNVTGLIYDENEKKVVGLQATAEPNPPMITLSPPVTGPPGSLTYPLGTAIPPTNYAPGDVIDVLIHNLHNLQMEVAAQRTTIVSLLGKLRTHGLIAP